MINHAEFGINITEEINPKNRRQRDNPEPVPEETGEERLTTRRDFLRVAAGTAATAMGYASEAHATDREPNQKEARERLEDDPEYSKFIHEVYEFMDAFNEMTDGISTGKPKPISMRGKDRAHDMFIEKFEKKMQWALEKAFTADDLAERIEIESSTLTYRDDRDVLYEAMKQFDALGLYYSYMSSHKPYDASIFEKQVGWAEDMFLTRTSDYIPFQYGYAMGGDKESNFKDSVEALDIRNRTPDDKELELLKDFPGLNQDRYYQAFTKMLSDSEIRAIFEKQDTTIAEMYSIFKAVIKKQFENGPGVLSENADGGDLPNFEDRGATIGLIKKMLRVREKFKKIEFLGSNTKHFIDFSCPNEKDSYRATTFNELRSVIKENGGIQVVSLQPSSTEEGEALDVEGNKLLLRMAIRTSDRETFIHFEGHGSEENVSMGNETDYTIDELAEDLVTRVQAQGKKTLADAGILIDACFSNDFAKGLGERIYARLIQQGVDTNDVKLPNVVAMTQTGSLAKYTSSRKTTHEYYERKTGSVLKLVIQDAQHILAKEGKITGEFLMRYVQPRLYHVQDMTFFMNVDDEGFTEIGGADPRNKTVIPA